MIKFSMKTKIIILILINLLITLQTSLNTELFVIIYISLFYILQREFKFVFKSLAIYLLISLRIYCLAQMNNLIVGSIVFTLIIAKKLFPNIFFATAMMKTSHFGELLYALSSFKLPKKIVIMLSIIFRFFPSFYLEMKNNTRAFKLRTYKVSKLSEYFYYFIYFSVVPLMRRAELVSDELSQVAVLRGIESNNPRTSMFAEPLYFYEYIAIFLLAGLFLYEVF